MRSRWAWLALLLVLPVGPSLAQKKPPPKKKSEKKEQSLPGRIGKIRDRLSKADPTDATEKMLASWATAYLERADEQLRAGQPFAADRMVGAADALSHAGDHLQHSKENADGKPLPEAEQLARALEKTYFRVLQADYFFRQSKDAQAKPLVGLARQFYQRARKAYDTGDTRQADEYSKAAGEIVKALEHLAQAATPVPVPPRMK